MNWSPHPYARALWNNLPTVLRCYSSNFSIQKWSCWYILAFFQSPSYESKIFYSLILFLLKVLCHPDWHSDFDLGANLSLITTPAPLFTSSISSIAFCYELTFQYRWISCLFLESTFIWHSKLFSVTSMFHVIAPWTSSCLGYSCLTNYYRKLLCLAIVTPSSGW